MNPVILIPARMASTRLPGKPLADIGGKPMIVRVAECAAASAAGRVVVCTDTQSVADAVAVGNAYINERFATNSIDYFQFAVYGNPSVKIQP